MKLERQIEIMKAQLSSLDNLLEKMAYMNMAFDNDPEYTQEARDIVRGYICSKIKKDGL